MEVSGDGNSYTTQFRQYDPRLGRWKSLDPLMKIQPWYSPYVAFNNNPIYFVDPTGLIGGPAKEEPKLAYNAMLYAQAEFSPECKNFHYINLPKFLNENENFTNKLYRVTGVGYERYAKMSPESKNIYIHKTHKENRTVLDPGNKTREINHTSYPVSTDFIGGGGKDDPEELGIVLDLEYKSSKGNKHSFSLPLASLGYDSQYMTSFSDVVTLLSEESLDFYSNCFADALGLKGIMTGTVFEKHIER
ncbi:RHS repeat-associated core domain-containing protein [Brumimicrobium mesophilum]|uniref:RHS repeat-associated core domain-containing protein n=1 Tax=Brumimicrobium mesophilum TaxID=392717 RepID=UPI000D142022|nr:RHS repeat-associated core domain-containing protein [Brumimicrobium mesophilum]